MTKHKAFDQNLVPITVAGTKCCYEVIRRIEKYEQSNKLRKRRRKKADQSSFEQTISCIVANLFLHDPDIAIRITRSHINLGKQDRYRTKVLGKSFPNLIDLMEKLNFLTQVKAERSFEFGRKQSVIFPTDRINELIHDFHLTKSDFGQGEYPEIIILKGFAEGGDKKAHYWDKAGYLQYEDDAHTNRMRSELQQINSWLMTLDIDYEFADKINIHNRRLRRYFSCGDTAFISGGRLFGGFWLEISKKDRNLGLSFNGEDIFTLDYRNLSPTILYGIKGKTPPSDDGYIVPGYEAYRSGVKKIFNCMLFTDGPLKKFPKGIKKEFEREHRVLRVTDTILQYHHPIANLLNSQIGHQVQKVESDIIVCCLLMCIENAIPALPVHDALIFPISKKEEGRNIMQSAFRKKMGLRIMVEED